MSPVISWPAAFLASVIVTSSFCYHYLLVRQGVDPVQAVQYLLFITVPLVALILPASSAAAAARAVLRALSSILGSLGGGAR